MVPKKGVLETIK